MAIQIDWLQTEINQATERFGQDDPIVRALQQQLDGYKSMQVNRDQNFRVGTVPSFSTVAGIVEPKLRG